MRDLPVLTPDYFEILVVRELRKAGFDVGQPRVHRRSELAEPERGFVLELVIPLGGAGAARRALVLCRRQDGAVTRDIVESAKTRLADAGADIAIIFATVDFADDALAAAQENGVTLLRIVDARTVFAAGAWGDGTSDHYPSWLPAHVAQLVDRDAAGQPRLRTLEAGRLDLILDATRGGPHG